MENSPSLNGEISRIKKMLVLAFVFVVLGASLVICLFHYNTKETLAKSYILASRNSILIGDYRQAISSLAPSVQTCFSKVLVHGFNGLPIIEIPVNDVGQNHDKSFLEVSVVEPIFAGENEKKVVAEAVFYYSILMPIFSCLGFSVVAFFVFYQLLKYSRRNLEEQHAYLLNQRQLETISAISTQVAHDIRSPLSAIAMISSSADFSSFEAKTVMKEALKRINDITNDLMTMRKNFEFANHRSNPTDSGVIVTLALMPLIESIIAEKNVEFLGRFVIESDLQEAQSLRVNLDPAVFMRIMSNLLNNSAEAMDKAICEVSVHVRAYTGTVAIMINDNGCGIPDSLLSQLGQRGITRHDRVSDSGPGSGLGFWHAKREIESFGGKIDVFSKVGVGTQIVITLATVS